MDSCWCGFVYRALLLCSSLKRVFYGFCLYSRFILVSRLFCIPQNIFIWVLVSQLFFSKSVGQFQSLCKWVLREILLIWLFQRVMGWENHAACLYITFLRFRLHILKGFHVFPPISTILSLVEMVENILRWLRGWYGGVFWRVEQLWLDDESYSSLIQCKTVYLQVGVQARFYV